MNLIKTSFIYSSLLLLLCLVACKQSAKTPSDAKQTISGMLTNQLDSSIWAVFQDQQERYWFGSNGSGLYVLEDGQLRLITREQGLLSNSIRGIHEDKAGNILVETFEGISKYDGTSWTTLLPIKATPQQWKLTADDLWFNCNGSLQHVYRYDGTQLYELRLPIQDLKNRLGIDANQLTYSPYSVYGVSKDQQGNIWFGTVLAGAFCYNGNSFLWIGESELFTLPDGRVPGVRAILEDKDGFIWLSNFISKYRIDSTLELGYERFAAIDTTKEPLSGKLPYFNDALRGQDGNLWMISYGAGLWKYDGSQLFHFPLLYNGIEALPITIYQDQQGLIWIGTNNAGLFTFDGTKLAKFELSK